MSECVRMFFNGLIDCDIAVPAYFRVKEINQTARVGEDIILVCDVEGDLPIQVSNFPSFFFIIIHFV